MADHEYDAELAAVPVFAGLSRRQRGKLLDLSRVVTHDDGHELATEGEGSLALHVVLDGQAVVSIHGTQVRELGPGDSFGEISLIDGKPRSATVTARGPLTTLAVPHHAFNELLDDDPAAARVVLVQLCERLREAEAG
jgi:CRP/FNR family cyclic AMP-dependent transcriptional regulator